MRAGRPIVYGLRGREPFPLKARSPRTRISAWALSRSEACRVGFDEIGPVTVSTVFLGVDPGSGREPPQLFETMVFSNGCEPQLRRYSTWDEAERGHNETVALLRGELR